jgi:recombination protein RecA
MPKDSPPSLSDVLKDVSKKFSVPIGSMSEVADEVVGLTTNNLAIDYITCCGGLPVGRIAELYGLPASGKTTLALMTAAALQETIKAEKSSDHILYLDFEHAMDGEYAANLGLDVEHPSFILAQPHWLEDGAEIGEKLIKTGKIRLSIWDSVAEMTPRELEFGVRTNAMERARLMNSLLQRLNSLLHEQNCAGVFLNHMVEAIQMGGRPGMPPQETSPGGKALKFYASLRLAFKQIKNVKGKAPDALTGQVIEQVVATHVKVKVTKNKVGKAWREAEVRVRLGRGFDDFWSAIQVLAAHGRVNCTQGTGVYYFDQVPSPNDGELPVNGNGRKCLRGEPALLAFADAHPAWRHDIIAHARDVIDKFGADETFTTAQPDEDDLLNALGSVVEE